MPTIHSKFEEIVKLYPNNIAYKHNNNIYTYDSINNMANNFANILCVEHKKVDSVCVFLDQGVNSIVSMLALSKSYKTILPLNTMMPVIRLVKVLEHYNIKTVITSEKYYKKLKNIFNGTILISDLNITYCDNINLKYDNSNFEFIILNTSGSTGVPKGVVQTHKNMLFSIETYLRLYNINSTYNHSLVYPTGFLGGVRDTLVSLLSGATLIYYDKYGKESMSDWIIKNNINILSLPIKFLRDLYKSIENKNIQFESVKIVRPGADISYKSDFDRFKQHFPNAKYYLLFSSSETGVVLQNILDHNSIIKSELLPLGTSVKNVEAYIVDENNNIITTENEVGHLVLKSKYLFKEYKNDPDKTAQVLKKEDNYSIYKSNDYVKYLDGQIYFEGRVESHVKINGARVNPSYIAAFASEIVENPYCMYSTKYKNLYLFYESSKNVTEIELKKFLFKNLEFYMVPARCIKVDKIPQKENGKIDRILIDQTIDSLIKTHDNTKLSFLHKKLVNIFEKHLNKQNIKITDNYFDNLGGDSLTAQLIISDIEHELSINLKDNILYEYSTIKELVKELESNSTNFFKSVKHIIKGDSSLTPVVWITGYPNIIRKHFKYKGDFYYVDSHYNRFASIPSPFEDIVEYCNVITKELIKEIKSDKMILAGYSIGSVYALELSKQLKEKGIEIEFLFLLDPRNTINILNNKKSNDYYLIKLYLFVKYLTYSILWNIQKVIKIKIIKRFNYIHAIYALHRLKYNFNYINDKTILVQRINNYSTTRYSFNKLFNNLKVHKLNVKKHSDFFSNQSVIQEWMNIFNYYLK